MRVLVTRPDPGGSRTAEKLVALGHDPVRMPLFETRLIATPDDLPPAVSISGLIATSARALALFEPGGQTANRLRDVPFHAVGPATAAAARKAGFGDVREGGGTAEALARSVIAQHRVEPASGRNPDGPPKALLYLAGKPRTATIEDAFFAAGCPLLVLPCYEMTEISYPTDFIKSDIVSPAPDLVLLYSANAARRFAKLFTAKGLGKALDSVRFVCLSTEIATQLPIGWRRRVITAKRPDEDSLLASLTALG